MESWQVIVAIAGIVLWLLLVAGPFPLFAASSRRRRFFYCVAAGREVEVEFEEGGLPGLRHPIAVCACSAFDPPEAVGCRRLCLDRDVRRLGQPWVPLARWREP
ncbi:MAG TPA: hypothetical protein VEL75_13840 [Candidatus Methylomirabilis sp.]|nr:hypothetical protein [Candidatus Methylomirabilis sp.]